MLKNIKILLGIDPDDTSKDALLKLIISSVTSRLQVLLGGIEPPESLEYIILEVAIKRYNRIGSEGLTSHSVEGETLSFNDSDFDAFASEIQAFLDTQNSGDRGKVRFI